MLGKRIYIILILSIQYYVKLCAENIKHYQRRLLEQETTMPLLTRGFNLIRVYSIICFSTYWHFNRISSRTGMVPGIATLFHKGKSYIIMRNYVSCVYAI